MSKKIKDSNATGNSSSSTAASSTDEPDHEYRELFDKEIPKNRDLALNQKKLNEAIDNLLSIEKQTRNSEDLASTREICLEIIDLCWESKDTEALLRNFMVLSKRKSQLKEVVKSIVQRGQEYVKELLDTQPLCNELIDTLLKITEGKIYVENERAELTKTLCEILEKEGKVHEASKLLQGIQIETYGSMPQREKVQFLLEQTRLCLDCNDWIRAKIISNKISEKVLQQDEYQDLKVAFRKLLIRYYTHKKNYLQICRCYLSMFETPSVKENKQQAEHYLKMVSLYVCLSEHAPEQSDLLHRVYKFKALEDLQVFNRMLRSFITPELICWSRFTEIYKTTLNALDVFSSDTANSASSAASSSTNTARGEELWEALRHRVIEHNIRVLAAYYTKITTKRFAELLELDLDESEKHLSRLVVNKNVYARINRPGGLITFRKPQLAPEELNKWSSNVSELLGLLEKTSHLIQRENMVYKVRHGLSQSQPL
mmetsp:Transcript_2112/g.3017  ORF Transcript_2112/g.3017 Transcript_2112/m.3017 type:complete len:486 (+) Transcript_2112:35-1492(+)